MVDGCDSSWGKDSAVDVVAQVDASSSNASKEWSTATCDSMLTLVWQLLTAKFADHIVQKNQTENDHCNV